MSSHLSLVAPGTPAIDYEKVKEFFFSKLEGDLHGRGRMESALFHTAQWIFMQGCHEREQLLEKNAALEADNVTLRHALRTTAEGAAELLAEAQQLRSALRFNEWTAIEEGAMPPERVVVLVTDGVNSWPAFHEDEAWKFWTPHGSRYVGPVFFWTDMPRSIHA